MSTSSSASASDEGSHLSQSDLDWTTLDQTLELSSQPDEPGDHEDIVCVAIPPSLSSTTSVNEVALTGSAALDVLDQLLANDEIGKERAARLRRKYNSLRENLETSRQLDNTLLMEAKSLEHQLGQQRKILERGANFPDADNSQNGRLRQNLLTKQNELDQTNHTLKKLENEIATLKEELGQVEREYSRQPKREELEQHIRDLARQRDDFKSEIEKRGDDIQRLREDLDKKNFKISAIQQEADEMRQLEDLLQIELIAIRNMPSIPKEIDNIKKQIREAKENIDNQSECLAELQPQIAESEDRMSALQSELTDVVRELKESENILESDQIHLGLLHKDLNTAKEREATLHEDRARLELQWRHRCLEHRGLLETNSTKNKEKDRELKSLKKAELSLGIISGQREQIARKQAALENSAMEQRVWCETVRSRRDEVAREVEQLTRSLSLASGLSAEHTAIMDRLQSTEQRLKAEISRQISILHDLKKDQVSMTKFRDQEAKDFSKIKRQQRSITDSLITKEGEIDEHRKRLGELQMQLKDFASAYEVVKAERNKLHSHIQLMQQVGAELAEKSKVLQNETDILRTGAVTKERLLQKCSLVTTVKVAERDTQRQELVKFKLSQGELNSQLETSREDISKLTRQINNSEQELTRLRRHYEQSVQDRNDLGLQLIERNEEVCVFYEKMNIQESQLRKANMELTAREEEMRFLNMETSHLQNDVFVSRKFLPMGDKIEMDLVIAQIELQNCQETLKELEQAVECASDPARMRLLGGDNPSRKQLNVKLDVLECKLSQCEQQLLEKELLFEQVCKLTDRANRRVDSQRDSTLSVAKKVNTYQTKIKESNRKMMALVSELSMTQAQALGLQQESREAELKLEQVHVRLTNGEPPDEESKSQWEKMIKQKESNKTEELVRRKLLEEEESRTLPGGAISYADPRPNAYMPMEEDTLPIPKPYGSHAPFKPAPPGANLRHIRKPEPKPIDI